eukprot:11740126-Alexandrium_andersonii.AAC.1
MLLRPASRALGRTAHWGPLHNSPDAACSGFRFPATTLPILPASLPRLWSGGSGGRAAESFGFARQRR